VDGDVREACVLELRDVLAPGAEVVAEHERLAEVLVAHELRDWLEVAR